MNEMQKILHLQKVFTDAYKSPLNILVLDDIDLIIDWVPIGPRFSSSVLAAIKGLMKNKPPQGRPLLIFGTTSEKTVLQQLQLDFQAQIAVPNVNSQDQLAKIMQHSGIFSDSEIRGAIADISPSRRAGIRLGSAFRGFCWGFRRLCRTRIARAGLRRLWLMLLLRAE
jgi:vesicle-fusing ATPase